MSTTISPRRIQRRRPRRAHTRALTRRPAPWSPVARVFLALVLAIGVLGGGALLYGRDRQIHDQRRAAEAALLERLDQEAATLRAQQSVLSSQE